MSNDTIVLQIAASIMRDRIPKESTLEARLRFAMEYAKDIKNEQDLFWMVGCPSDDLKFRCALAAVMTAGTDEERSLIKRSLVFLQTLNATCQGVPVDFSAFGSDEYLLPLMKFWTEN